MPEEERLTKAEWRQRESDEACSERGHLPDVWQAIEGVRVPLFGLCRCGAYQWTPKCVDELHKEMNQG